MKILIVSDTHGQENNLEKVLEKEGDIDRLIHLGDVEGGEDYIRSMVDVPVDMVAGNNDYYSDLPGEMLIRLGNYQAMLTHGHYYYVSRGTDRLAQAALERGADIVMYGHTHVPHLEQRPGLMILNPGSLSLPRQENRQPSYIVMEIDEKGAARYRVGYLKSKLPRWLF